MHIVQILPELNDGGVERGVIDLNREWNITVIMIEHDMGVVMDISKKIIVLDFGKKIAEGIPDEILENKKVQKAYLGEQE